MRRDLIPLALAFVLVPTTVATVLGLMPAPPPSALAFPRPAHRLAVAVDTASRAEFASVQRGAVRTSRAPGIPSAKPVRLAADEPYLFLPSPKPPNKLVPSALLYFDLTGKAKDGREVQVTVRPDRIGQGSIADFHGDARLAADLAPGIAEALANPAHPHESDEDRADLIAFFGPKVKPGVPASIPPTSNGTPERIIIEAGPN